MSWLVVGAGISGIGAATLIKQNNNHVYITDDSLISSKNKKLFNQLEIPFFENDKESKHIQRAETGLVLSPGVPMSHPYVAKALELKIPIWSEIDVALSYFTGKVIGVTGTNGKSTLVSMLYHLFKKLGKNVELAGNIGTPPSLIIAEGKKPDYLILELSSYQLEHSSRSKIDIAIISNISEDHLQRHGQFDKYLEAKWRIFDNMPPNGICFIGEDVALKSNEWDFEVPNISFNILTKEDALKHVKARSPILQLWHNQVNAYFALRATSSVFGLGIDGLLPLLEDFQGLPCRYEILGTIKGQRIINDSKATNVASTLVALSNQQKPTLLFIGGKWKGESFDDLFKYQSIIKKVIFFGKDGEKLKNHFGKISLNVQFSSLKDALDSFPKYYLTEKEPLEVLFSPACAAFDEFTGFQERGDFFGDKISKFLDKVQ